jgi:polyhydroxyalkanoate synthase
LQSAQQFQQTAMQQWTQMLQAAPGAASPTPSFGVPGTPDLAAMFSKIAGQAVKFDSAKLVDIQQSYLKELAELWNQGTQVKPPKDKRFADASWSSNPMAAFSAAAYLLNARTLMALTEAVEGDAKTKSRINFAVMQWIDASAPSNFLAFNAEAQKKALETKGESLSKGIQNLLSDMKQGFVSMTDMNAFQIGKNVATTEGNVVFENEYFQLIEYKPLTAKVYERPFLIVPPCINKYYILDLQPENSFVRYAIEQGHHTFLVSWRNPDQSCADKTWDDYIENGIIKAIEVTRDIGGTEQINALGFCVGGTMLGTGLGVLKARDQDLVKSATFLTTLLDFSNTGVLDVFIDENFVKFREMQMGQGGLLPGRDLALTFSFLRPNDLVWNYVVGNYLKGETPPPFDLLYWNSDSTNLPGPFYAWYLRNTYLNNSLIKPGQLTICGEKFDLSQVDVPTYIFGSREDHIVPPGGAYASTQHLNTKKRFVLGASGHIAGVINPASKGKRSYWTGPEGKFPASFKDWMEQATEHPGSWWTDWSDWLKQHAGKQIAAPKSFGSRKYKVIEAAPGRYVQAKA